jgi:hypothetical protein
MPQGEGTYGTKVGRPKKPKRMLRDKYKKKSPMSEKRKRTLNKYKKSVGK